MLFQKLNVIFQHILNVFFIGRVSSTFSQLNLYDILSFILTQLITEIIIEISILNAIISTLLKKIQSHEGSFICFNRSKILDETSKGGDSRSIADHHYRLTFWNVESGLWNNNSQILWMRLQICGCQSVLGNCHTQIKIFWIIFPWRKSVSSHSINPEHGIELYFWI